MSHLHQSFFLDVTLRVHWLSEELNALAEARWGRVSKPLRVTVQQGEGLTVAAPVADSEFVESLRGLLAESPESPVQITSFVTKLCAELPAAVMTVLRERKALGASLTDNVELPLHLPALDRKTWKMRAALLPSMDVSAEGGALYGTGANTAGAAAAIALSRLVKLPVTEIRERGSLTFTYREEATGERLRRLRPVFSAYRFGPELESRLTQLTAGAEVEFRVSLPSRATDRWATAPGEAEAAFLPVWSNVTHAMQRTLRRWLPVLALPQTGDLARTDVASSVLCYGLTRSFCGRSKTQMTYDVLDSDSLKSAHYSVSRGVPNLLPEINQILTEAGFPEAARYYRVFRQPEFLDAIRKDRKLFPTLLQLDGLLWNDLVELGAIARTIASRSKGDPRKALTDAVRNGAEFGRRFQRRLSALLPQADWSPLAKLALLEATAALAPHDEREAVVTINGEVFLSQPLSVPVDLPLAA